MRRGYVDVFWLSTCLEKIQNSIISSIFETFTNNEMKVKMQRYLLACYAALK